MDAPSHRTEVTSPWIRSAAPLLFSLRSAKSFILAVVTFAWFSDLYLYGIVIPVLPFALTSRTGIEEAHIQYWNSVLLAAYGSSFAFFSPVFGYVADKVPSRQIPMILGLFAVGGATALLCVGNSKAVLVTGRALQGASAAMVCSVGLALVNDTFASEEIGHAMGFIGIANSMAILLAPLLGGLVYSHAGYYAVFAMAFGLIAVDILLRLAIIERKRADEIRARLAQQVENGADPGPQLSESKEHSSTTEIVGTSTPEPAGEPIEQNSFRKHPFTALLTSRRFLISCWGVTVQAIILTAFDSTLPIFSARVFSFGSFGAGALMIPLLAPSLLSPLIGHLTDTSRSKHHIHIQHLVTGAFLFAIPPLVLLRFITHPSISQIAELCVLLCMIGFSVMLISTPLMAGVSHIITDIGGDGCAALAYGLYNLAFAAGTSLGPIWGGLVLNDAGWATMGWSIGLVCGVTTVLTGWGLKGL